MQTIFLKKEEAVQLDFMNDAALITSHSRNFSKKQENF